MDFDSAPRECQSEDCVDENVSFANGYITSYDVIPFGFSYIPGKI